MMDRRYDGYDGLVPPSSGEVVRTSVERGETGDTKDITFLVPCFCTSIVAKPWLGKAW